MSSKTITGIYIAPTMGGFMTGRAKIALKAGKGIVGDRYYSETGRNRSTYKGQPDFELTLIESEVIESFNKGNGNSFHESDFRRNLITKGVRLNDLEGQYFTINGISLYGVRLCEPCASLQRRLGVSILPELVGKGGLRAQVRGSGILSVGASFSLDL
ncbi:MAG TPA: sulfurase [Porticoccaceae bacterium]|nr:sulfurase [Porticoccaceae bacterium]